jgi:bla regulator protein BlaR1
MEAVWNTVIRAIGWSIFHSLWQGAVLYAILFLLMAGLPKLSSRNRHNLAFGGICLLFLAFCVTFVSFLEVPETRGARETAEVTVTLSTANPIPGLPAGMYERAEGLFPYMVALYALGLLVQLFLIATGFYKLNQLKQAARSRIPAAWQGVFENIVLDLRISKRVGFYLSEYVHVPLVIGYFKPIVLFPVALATQLDLKQVEAILIHELSHIRRNDYLLNLVKTGIETLLFFNPFVWLSSHFIQIEREHACDDLVLDLTGTPITYAHALLKIELLKVKDTPTLSLAASGNSQHLYQRIKRITDMKTNYMNPKQQIFAVALTVATLVSLAWANPREKKIVQTAVTTTVEQVQETAAKVAAPEVALRKRRTLKVIPVSLPIDTPRKKKSVKIITVDENGKRTEYKSVRELPDSIKAELDEHPFFVQAFPKGFPDTASLLALRKNAEALALKFNNPEERARLQKLGAEMAKRGELFRKKFDTPEQRAKWEKLGIEMRKQGELFRQKMNSPEERAKWKKLELDMKKHSEEMQKDTKEQQKEMLKLSEDMRLKAKEMQEMMYLPDVAVRVEKLKTEIKPVE